MNMKKNYVEESEKYLIRVIVNKLVQISHLDDRDEYVITELHKGASFNEVAIALRLGRERVMQIYLRGIRRLASAVAKMVFVEKLGLIEENRILRAKVAALKSKLIKRKPNDPLIENDFIYTRLIDTDLSVRALNCLKSAEIKTVSDLIRLKKTDLLKFRNFGRKTLREIEDLLDDNGLTFIDE
jgi:hypothetical protein